MNYGRESLSSQLQNPSIIEKEAVDLKFAICPQSGLEING